MSLTLVGHSGSAPLIRDAYGRLYAGERATVAGAGLGAPLPVSEISTGLVTLPNAVTLLGYCASLAWVAGGPMWLGLLGLVADEADGRLARATGTTSRFGGELDYAVDVTMTGLSAVRALGLPGLALLPIVTSVQAGLRANERRPPFGFGAGTLHGRCLPFRGTPRGDPPPEVPVKPTGSCFLSSEDCSASGSVVRLEAGDPPSVPCLLCGRILALRPIRDRVSGALVARLPKHRRWDLERAAAEARELGRVIYAADRAERASRVAVRRDAKNARVKLTAALRLLDKLPAAAAEKLGPDLDRRRQRLAALRARLDRQKRARLPADVVRVVKRLEDESGIDLGSVDGGHILDFLRPTAVGRKVQKQIASLPELKQVRGAVAAIVRASGARSWPELETRPVVGQLGALPYLRTYEGLEQLRAPGSEDADAVLDRLRDRGEEIPF